MSADKVIFYRDHAKRWRWRYVAANGHILADSGRRGADLAVAGVRLVYRAVWA